jgi:hypothetical protein
MHPGIETLGRFRVDIIALANDASESGLNVRARAAEPVVKVKVAEGGVHVVPPHQPNHPPAKPDTLRITGRAVHRPAGFGKLVDLALGFLGRVGWLGGPRLVAGFGVATLREGWRRCRRRREEYGEGETHDRGHGQAG